MTDKIELHLSKSMHLGEWGRGDAPAFCKSHNSLNLGAFALGNNPEPGEGQFFYIVC